MCLPIFGNVTTTLLGSTGADYFRINENTAEIFLVKALDFEHLQQHTLDIRATDGGGLTVGCKNNIDFSVLNSPHGLKGTFLYMEGSLQMQKNQCFRFKYMKVFEHWNGVRLSRLL